MKYWHENIRDQVDGLADTFTTVRAFVSGTLAITYNGQAYPPGYNIAQTTPPNTFRLSFAPENLTETTLSVTYQEVDNGILEGLVVVATSLPPRGPGG